MEKRIFYFGEPYNEPFFRICHGWDEPVAGHDLYDPDKVAALFETQEQLIGNLEVLFRYHAISVGNLMGEIIKRDLH